jgi:hypothetical protein
VLLQIMTGNSILKDGRSVVEVYGVDLDKLKEGERIGVMRTSGVMQRVKLLELHWRYRFICVLN